MRRGSKNRSLELSSPSQRTRGETGLQGPGEFVVDGEGFTGVSQHTQKETIWCVKGDTFRLLRFKWSYSLRRL